MHSAIGTPTPISPRASGRSRLSGCRRSESRSAMSLRIYTALEVRQKAANKTSASATRLASLHPCPKTTPTKRNPFLSHWCGRIRRTRAPVIGSVLCRAGRRAQIVLAEIAASLRQVPGNGVVPPLQRLQDLLPVRGEIEPAAEDHMKGRAGGRDRAVLDEAEVGPIVGVTGRILAQHQDVLAVEPPEIGEDVVVARIRGAGAEYGNVPARMEGRYRRHRVSVGGELEFLPVWLQLTEDFRHAGVIHDAVVETRALPGIERQHRRGDAAARCLEERALLRRHRVSRPHA